MTICPYIIIILSTCLPKQITCALTKQGLPVQMKLASTHCKGWIKSHYWIQHRLDALIQGIRFYIIKTFNFWGGLTGTSATLCSLATSVGPGTLMMLSNIESEKLYESFCLTAGRSRVSQLDDRVSHSWKISYLTAERYRVSQLEDLVSCSWTISRVTAGRSRVSHLDDLMSHSWKTSCLTAGRSRISQLEDLMSHSWKIACPTARRSHVLQLEDLMCPGFVRSGALARFFTCRCVRCAAQDWHRGDLDEWCGCYFLSE